MEIEKTIESADAVIVFISNIAAKKTGYVQKELRLIYNAAMYRPEGTLFAIPLRLESCDPPHHFKLWHWGDYFGEEKERTYQSLLKSLKTIYSQMLQVEAEETARIEKEKQLRKETEEIAWRETIERAIKQAEEKARREREEHEQREAEEIARREVLEKARKKAEDKALEFEKPILPPKPLIYELNQEQELSLSFVRYYEAQTAKWCEKGRKKSINTDYISIFEPSDKRIVDLSGRLYVVADGEGEGYYGARVCQFAVDKLMYEYFRYPEIEPSQRIGQILTDVNTVIYEYSRRIGVYMTTALLAAVVTCDLLVVANVGNCRAYLIRGKEVSQLTHDHTVLGELIANGDMTEEKAYASGIKNRPTRSIGSDSNLTVDIFDSMRLLPEDKILLCTDGLTRYARRQDIAKLTSQGEPKEIVDRLVNFAVQRGGEDNVAVSLTLLK